MGGNNTAFLVIPEYVPNGEATLVWFDYVSSKLCRPLTIDRQCKDMNPCSMPLYILRGVEDPSASREREGQIGCLPDNISVAPGVRPWSYLTVFLTKRSLPRANVKSSFPLKNMTTAFPLWATASSAFWAAASGLPARTNSSTKFSLSTTVQAPNSWGGTAPAPVHWPSSRENITSAQATTIQSPQQTPISIHPTISLVKTPGKL